MNLMDKFIVEIPNFFPHELCKKMVEKFENDPRKFEAMMQYPCGDHVVYREKFNSELPIGQLDDWNEINIEFLEYLKKATNEYLKTLYYNFDYDQEHHPYDMMFSIKSTANDPLFIQRISRGKKYFWHCDNSPNGKGFLQVIVYLNTLDFHEGGCTEFANGRMIRPEIGKVLLFPCSWTYPHQGNEVKTDHKYICTTVVHCKGWN